MVITVVIPYCSNKMCICCLVSLGVDRRGLFLVLYKYEFLSLEQPAVP